MIIQRLYLKSPKEETSLLMLELRKDGEKIRVSTGINVMTAFWDGNVKTIKQGCPDYFLISQKLLSFNAIVAKEVMIAEANDIPLLELKNAILFAFGKIDEKKEIVELLHFYKWWAMNSFGNHHPTRQNWNHYVVLEEFLNGKDIPFSDVDYKFYLRFKAFLDNNKGYKPNTTATHLRDLKAVLTEARNRGMHNSTAYLAIKKKFENVDTVYLTIDEINKLYEFPLAGVKQMARDLFVLGCHTAMRYSDYSRLHPLHIHDNRIVFRTQKTDETVIIPAHPRVMYILERWNGAPKVSQVMLNKLIKEICREMGIFNQLMPVKDGKRVEYIEKYNLITTHTARRSAATNMYLLGIPAQSIMKITGHTTESSFMKYLRISKDENATLIANNPFFNK
jgi:hypothetical protein